MAKGWMKLSNRFSKEYQDGVKQFLDFAYANVEENGKIRCPCLKCNNYYQRIRKEVKCHLLVNGIVPDYSQWIYHGETFESHDGDCDWNESGSEVGDQGVGVEETRDQEDLEQDDMEGMLHDMYTRPYNNNVMGEESTSCDPHVSEGEGEKYVRLATDAQQELYPGCQSFSKLSFIVKLMHLKSMNNWSEKSFDMLLQFLNEVLPNGSNVPKSFYEARKVIRDLGLNYVKIDVCKNDCALFWGPHEGKTKCPTCEEPRWKSERANGVKIPHKVLRYFPLKPRLQRLFINKDIASDMRWHKDKLIKEDNVLRHPADGEAWKEFDKIHESFARDPRNVRLGLSSDGFNPFSHMSSTHSTWPVVLVPYNLPPWKCMKQPFFMLSLLIPGPKSPGNDMDVFLQPLIKELKLLWEVGVQTYDASTGSTFQLHAAVMWTINDFPAYANLSGWSTKGKLACPVCNEETCSIYLKNGKKICYMGHRRFLPIDHKWRGNRFSFDGRKEHRQKPKELSGDDILAQLEKVRPTVYGKHTLAKRKREEHELNWTKRSIFFDLPYWKSLKLRHNLDVMHIEKNVCENILGTLLNIDGKTKDTIKSRWDLEEMRIRSDLHAFKKGDKWMMPPACYTLSNSEKRTLCEFWQSLKLPDGYGSNISRCVNVKEGRISGMKSHDYHIFIQRLLPLSIRGYLQKEVCQPLIELGSFFRELCSKTLRVDVLESLEKKLVVTMCKLERIFPPSFFDVMVHLPIHLAREAILGGPVQGRWMYPFERHMHTLKLSVGNKARPEGSIAEAYILNECVTFCSMYLRGVETRFNRLDRNYDGDDFQEGMSIFSYNGRLLGKADYRRLTQIEWHKARLYVLENCDEIEEYVKEHKDLLKRECNLNIEKRHAERFPKWFEDRVKELERQSPDHVSKQLRTLSWGPDRRVRHYKGCVINGYRFHIKDHDKYRKTQNSGVVVVGEHEQAEIDFYGQLYDIIELEYIEGNRVVLFKCDWWDLGKKKGVQGIRIDEYGFVSVNTNNTWYTDQPFVLAYQAEQVFYVADIILGNDWKVAVKNTPRDKYDFPEAPTEELMGDEEPYQQSELNGVHETVEVDDGSLPLRRDDIPIMEINTTNVERRKSRHDGDDGFINDVFEENDILSENEYEEDIVVSDGGSDDDNVEEEEDDGDEDDNDYT